MSDEQEQPTIKVTYEIQYKDRRILKAIEFSARLPLTDDLTHDEIAGAFKALRRQALATVPELSVVKNDAET